jgi:hypothetical protein
MKAAVIPIN